MKTYEINGKQIVGSRVKEEKKSFSAKRVDIVSVRLVKERSLLYKDRAVKSPEDKDKDTRACARNYRVSSNNHVNKKT